jgi:hypothetical protein
MKYDLRTRESVVFVHKFVYPVEINLIWY